MINEHINKTIPEGDTTNLRNRMADLLAAIDRIPKKDSSEQPPTIKVDKELSDIALHYVHKSGHKTPPVVYHYTSNKAFLEIVSSKSLRFTNLMYLNDSSEFNYAKSIFLEVVEGLKLAKRQEDSINHILHSISLAESARHETHGVFVCCFSKSNDNVNMWRGYSGRSSRICIGFNFPILLEASEHIEASKYVFVPCVYDQALQRKLIKGFVHRCIWNYRRRNPDEPACIENDDGGCKCNCGGFISLCREAQILFAAIKHPSFVGEEEWRVVALGGKSSFRASESLIIPFKTIGFAPHVSKRGDNHIYKYRQLFSVVVGPTPHADLNIHSIKSVLQSYNYDGFTVNSSKVPYRDW